jgi:hypothetical protein
MFEEKLFGFLLADGLAAHAAWARDMNVRGLNGRAVRGDEDALGLLRVVDVHVVALSAPILKVELPPLSGLV